MEKLRIGLVYDLRENYQVNKGQPEDLYAEFDFASTIEHLKSTIIEIGHDIDDIGDFKNLVSRVGSNYNWDLVFNIAEGFHGRGRQAQVPALLEAYQIPFTGSDAVTLGVTTDKAITKKIWQADQLPTSPHNIVYSKADLFSKTFDNLEFPLFAKPLYAGSSAGVTQNSFIESIDSLHEVVKNLLAHYNQPVIVENFLPGEEYTIGILGNDSKATVLNGFVQISESNHGIRSAKEKKSYNVPSDFCKPIVDLEVKEAVYSLALQAYQSVQCRDIGRVDIRADSKGKLYLLEINALTNLDVVSSFNYMAELQGISYLELINTIIVSAYERYYPRSSLA